VFIAAALPAVAAAQVGPVGLIQMPPLFGEFRPEVGAWVEYSVHETDSDSIMNVKIAVTGKEKCVVPEPAKAGGEEGGTDDGEKAAKQVPPRKPSSPKADCWWVEVITQIPDGPSAAVKLYSEGDPRNVKNLLRFLSRAGKRNPMEARPEALAKLQKFPGGAIPENARVTKREMVTSPDGTDKAPSTIYEFRADGIPYVIWSCDRIPIYGVAKVQAPDLKIQFLKFGKNFKSTFPDMKTIQKKGNALEKPSDRLDIKKPGQGGIEEVKEKVKDDYQRPDLGNEAEPAQE